MGMYYFKGLIERSHLYRRTSNYVRYVNEKKAQEKYSFYGWLRFVKL